MSNQTTENFLAVWASFQWPESRPVTYRLYHDTQGKPLFYSMEELPGAYIVVDQPTYISDMRNVIVRDGKLVVLEQRFKSIRLQPDVQAGTPCDSRDICVVVDSNKSHTKWKLPTDDID